jgi:hypothetical protein
MNSPKQTRLVYSDPHVTARSGSEAVYLSLVANQPLLRVKPAPDGRCWYLFPVSAAPALATWRPMYARFQAEHERASRQVQAR